ncbi:hypothetical protein PV04_06277 [Phialophora macrospora]|uniref:HAUS augmin-like complex subunit 6 N-terminal domain-containing protein n=1 Tax=Phialophora macrospora TaxID=1851006 RepID=A0A0D2G4S2_9EURO|nr:hypothetical protein PV04_06277 [Phialophora macrospora]
MEQRPSPHVQWSRRSNISIFVHALHLLDLDLLPDWPSISEPLFTAKSAQNLHARVKATEWALYHLFRLYSPIDTQPRLSPHFPPTTSLQSKNLRAALYKWLAELKSNGILPREVVLRKTMLDECKGDKFEEVLAKFAMVVLKKTLAGGSQGRSTRDPSGHVNVNEQDARTLVPLIMAHRASLQASLRERQDLKAKAMAYSERLAQVRKEIASESQNLQAQMDKDSADGAEHGFSAREYELLREQVNLAFASDRRWARYIFEGSAGRSFATPAQKILPKWPIDHPDPDPDPDMRTAVTRDELPSDIDTGDSEEKADEPMRELQLMIAQNQERLEHLTRLQESLLPRTERESHPENATPEVFKPTVAELPHRSSPPGQAVSSVSKQRRFNKHQELTLSH